jgi:hypothetical protein
MRRLTLAAALGAAFATGAWGQSSVPVPLNNYTFTSGPGTGNNPVYVANRTFSAQGFSIANGGGSLSGPDACAGVHVHGSFFGLGDPGGNCGHGIIGLAQSAIPGASSLLQGSISSASSLLTGSIPGSAAGTLTLTRPGLDVAASGELFLFAAFGFSKSDLDAPGMRTAIGMPSNFLDDNPRLADVLLGGTGGGDSFARSQAKLAAEDAEMDMKILLYGTPFPSPEQVAKGPSFPGVGGLRDGTPKPPPPAANPQDEGSILSTLEEPTLAQLANLGNPAPKPAAEPPDPEKEKFLEKAAQDIADGMFSGDKDKGKAAATTLGNAPRDLQNRAVRKINERVQKIVNDALRTATNSAAGPPRSLN